MLGRHLLGIYEKAFPEDWSWERRLAEAKALGFDYMELSIDESDGRLERLLWSGRELEKLHSLSVEAGLPLMSLCLSAHRRFPLGSRDAEVRAAALDRGAGSIVAVHLKDTLAVGRDFPGQFRSVPFGSGCVDFKSCFARRRTLQDMLPCHPAALLAWLRDNEPQSFAEIRWVFSCKDYLRFRFTGEAAAELTDSSGSGLLDLRSRRYEPELLELFGLGEIRGALDCLEPLWNRMQRLVEKSRPAGGQ